MSTADILKDCEAGMNKALDRLSHNFKKVRTGRATTDMFDNVKVDYYGNPTPVNQMCSVNAADASSILVKPFEHKMLGEVEKAIQKANLGVGVSNDGVAVRVSVPPLNEERRKELAGEAKTYAEEVKVNARDARRDANKTLEGLKGDGVSEDDITKAKSDVDALLKKYEGKIDDRLKEKTDEIMAI